MQLTGTFSEFSWHDLLDLMGDRQLTGSISITPSTPSSSPGSSPSNSRGRQYQVWFKKGCLVAASQSSRRTNGLFWLMQHQGWISYNISQKLAQNCPETQSIGRYLREQGAMDDRQLQQLFNLQLTPVLRAISQLGEAQFKLETGLPLPLEQMTGLTLSAYDAQTLARRAIASQASAGTAQAQTPANPQANLPVSSPNCIPNRSHVAISHVAIAC